MLTSLVLIVRPETDGPLPKTVGNFSYAAFLKLVREYSESLAAELHDQNGKKPFTISPLQGPFTRSNGRVLASAENSYWLRITGLDDEITSLLEDLSEKDSFDLVLGNVAFQVEKSTLAGGEHRWAGQVRYEALYDHWLTGIARVPRKISMRFYSPTTFRSKGQNLPLPMPGLVFYQLLQKWNAYAPVFVGEDMAEIAENRLCLSRYQLETRMMHFGQYRQLGFTGDCEFYLKCAGDEVWARVLHLLADFAFYAGVGYKTTMGMGQVRRTDGLRRSDSDLAHSTKRIESE